MDEAIAKHYGRGGVLDSILRALASQGKDLTQLTPLDLAPVDEFHVGGREATIELARLAKLRAGSCVLDVGCGLGGSVRYLASEHGCLATGVDLTHEYVQAAAELARRAGMAQQVRFEQAHALALPFPDASFEVVWTEHAQMNIADKHTFYRELARVLVPEGQLVFHDVFQGPGGPPHFPVPWAEDATISFLVTLDVAREAISSAGLQITQLNDVTQRSLEWIEAAIARVTAGERSPLGLHLLLGADAGRKSRNNAANLRERRVIAVQAVAQKALKASEL